MEAFFSYYIIQGDLIELIAITQRSKKKNEQNCRGLATLQHMTLKRERENEYPCKHTKSIE